VARGRRHWLASVGIGVVAWGVLAVPFLLGGFDPFDLKLLDMKFRLRGERTAAPSIAIVGIDDATAHDEWPLPRDTYALAIRALLEGGAKAIGVDLRLPMDQHLESSAALARISAESDRVVHALWTPNTPAEEAAPPDEGMEFSLVRFGVPCPEGFAPEFDKINGPYPLLLQSMRRAGMVMLTEDPEDGTYRRIPPFLGRSRRCVPTLALALLGAARGDSIASLSGAADRIDVRWASGAVTSIPVDGERSAWIDFAGGELAFPRTISMRTLLHWNQEQDLGSLRAAFSGKTVLIGLTSRQEAFDAGATPFDSSLPLVYLHANLLDDLIRGRFLRRTGGGGYLLALLVLAMAAAASITPRGLAASAAIAGIITIAVLALIHAALALWAVEIPTVMAAGVVPVVFGLSASYRVLFLERAGRAREAEIRKGFILQESFLPDALLGKQIAGYRIEERLGAGGMGLVFRGVSIRTGRIVAVKILPGAEDAPDNLRRRFRHEALALARLNHSNVARMIEHGSRNGIDFLAMEYIRGVSLAERIKEGRVPEDEAIDIGVQICAGLAAAHDRGILHRDLKPANVMLSNQGEVKLVDFGIAQFAEAGTSIPTMTPLTATGYVVGTPAYMAPEVIGGREADRRTDIYGVGMILYEMVTGQWPYPPCSAQQMFWAIQNEPPLWPEYSGAEASRPLVLKCLSKDPKDRPASSIELGAALLGLNSSRLRV
jgi:CHASE2 domain-containing sensor protein/predicted Ser/Thr protein kinase